ncbi:MAG: YihY/virulence factor BrkB family protein [Ignavibacteriaceae bacterium]
MKYGVKKIWTFILEVFEKFVDDRAPKYGAALSFYTIFSLAPLLVVIIYLGGLIFGRVAARGRVLIEIQEIMGKEGATLIQTILKNASFSINSPLAIIISAIAILIGSTIVFVDIQESLNLIWKVKPLPGRGMIKGFIKDRLISFIMVLGTGFLLVFTLIISAVISSINDFVSEKLFNLPASFLQFLNISISFVIIFIALMAIFKFLPNVLIKWKDVWVGALVTSVMLLLGQYLIGLYLGTSSLSTTYGAAGSLVVFLLWIYYSSQILYLGAEFTHVYVEKFGDGIHPKRKFMKFEDTSVPVKN